MRRDSVRPLDESDLAKAGWPLSPSFKSMCEQSGWIETPDGRSAPIPLVIGGALRLSLLQFSPSVEKIEDGAIRIYLIGGTGKALDMDYRRSNDDMEKFYNLCFQLEQHINDMQLVDKRKYYVRKVGDTLRDLRENSKHVPWKDEFIRSGRPRKFEAQQVTAGVARAILEITGAAPTVKTDPMTGRAYGLWPDTLRAVFEAMHIRASVESQVRAYDKRERRLRRKPPLE